MSYELLGLGWAPSPPSPPPDDVPETKPFTFSEFVGSSVFAFVCGLVAMHLIDSYTLGTRTTRDRESTGDLGGDFYLQRRDARRAMEAAEGRRMADWSEKNAIVQLGPKRAVVIPKLKGRYGTPYPYGPTAGTDYPKPEEYRRLHWTQR